MLTDEERRVLNGWSGRRKTAQALTMRSRIMLHCAEGGSIGEVAPGCVAEHGGDGGPARDGGIGDGGESGEVEGDGLGGARIGGHRDEPPGRGIVGGGRGAGAGAENAHSGADVAGELGEDVELGLDGAGLQGVGS